MLKILRGARQKNRVVKEKRMLNDVEVILFIINLLSLSTFELNW